MVLRFFIFATAALFFGCTSLERDNPYDKKGNNSNLKKCEDIFNSSTHFCYDGEVYLKCGDIEYDPTVYFCEDSVIRIAKCDGKEYNPLYNGCCDDTTFELQDQRCKNDVIETKCGTDWYDSTDTDLYCYDNILMNRCGGSSGNLYDTTNPNQRCQNDVVENKCGNNWYDALDSDLRCRNNAVETNCGGEWYNNFAILPNNRCKSGTYETRCGTYWYDAANENLRCKNDAVEEKCVDEWYNFAILPNNRCKNGTYETRCGTDWYDAANENLRCKNDIVEKRCGTGNNWHNPETQFCNGNDIVDKCGGKIYNTEMQRCQNNIVETKCGTNWYNNISQYCSEGNVIDKGEFTDSRDGKKYKYVTIGTQVWMAENLNYEASGSSCLNNQESNCTTYGRLYDWTTAMVFSSNCHFSSCFSQITANHKGVCPSGWHLPSDSEWSILINYVDGIGGDDRRTSNTAGNYLLNNYDNNKFGFTALYGVSYSGDIGSWWSASESDADHAYCRTINNSYIYWYGYHKQALFSVRCVKN